MGVDDMGEAGGVVQAEGDASRSCSRMRATKTGTAVEYLTELEGSVSS